MFQGEHEWEGLGSQTPEIWQLLPPLQQAHPDTPGTATGSGRHWEPGGFLFWKQNPADVGPAETGESSVRRNRRVWPVSELVP